MGSARRSRSRPRPGNKFASCFVFQLYNGNSAAYFPVMRPSRRQTQTFTRPSTLGRPTLTALLVALQIGAYAAQWIMEAIGQHPFSFKDWLRDCLALHGAGIAAGHYWQFATFTLLHYSPLHVA